MSLSLTDFPPGSSHTLPGFLILSTWGEGSIVWSASELNQHGFQTLMPHTLQFTVPHSEGTPNAAI